MIPAEPFWRWYYFQLALQRAEALEAQAVQLQHEVWQRTKQENRLRRMAEKLPPRLSTRDFLRLKQMGLLARADEGI